LCASSSNEPVAARTPAQSFWRGPAAALGALLVAALLARLPFLLWGGLHFDSDQAVMGLMARHIGQGRAFPVYFYGQSYLFPVLSYLAAPAVAVAGLKVWVVKAPLLVMTVFLLAAAHVVLRRQAGLGPWRAALALSPLAVCNAVTASRLVEAQGGNLETLFWVVLLWLLRGRPAWLGLVAGVAAQNREIVLCGLAALVAVKALDRDLSARYLIRLAAPLALVWVAFKFAAPHGANYYPVGAPVRLVSLDAMWRNAGAAGRLLAALHGLGSQRLGEYSIASGLDFGGAPAAVCYAALGVLAVFSARDFVKPAARFPLYLVCASVLCVAVFVGLFNSRPDLMSVRYFLLTQLGVVAVAAVLLGGRLRKPAAVALAALALWHAAQSAALWREQIVCPPPWPHLDLARAVEKGGFVGVRCFHSDGYTLGFLMDERIPCFVTDYPRIQSWQDAFARLDGTVAVIVPKDAPGPPGEVVRGWRVVPLRKRAGQR